MQAKALELRDEGTFIPLLAVDMNPDTSNDGTIGKLQRYLLRIGNDRRRLGWLGVLER